MDHLTIYKLRRQYRRIALLVEEESRRRFPDSAVLARLKRHKLSLKDQLSRLDPQRSQAA